MVDTADLLRMLASAIDEGDCLDGLVVSYLDDDGLRHVVMDDMQDVEHTAEVLAALVDSEHTDCSVH